MYVYIESVILTDMLLLINLTKGIVECSVNFIDVK